MALHCTKANHIYDRHEYDKNTVRKDVKCRQFIAYYVIGRSLVYIGVGWGGAGGSRSK